MNEETLLGMIEACWAEELEHHGPETFTALVESGQLTGAEMRARALWLLNIGAAA